MVEGFHRPTTVREAVALKAEWADRACYIAGGTQVNALGFSQSPAHLISLDRLGLDEVRSTSVEWSVGACCTVQELIESAEAPECLRAAGRQIANRNLRNRATIGGHLAGGRVAGEIVPLLIALDATVDADSPNGPVHMPVLAYVVAPPPDALILRLRIGKPQQARFVAIEKFARMANDVPIISAAVTLTKDGTTVRDPIIAVCGAAEQAVRLHTVEEQLDGHPLPAGDVIESWVTDAVAPIGDVRGGAAYRRHVAGVVVAATVLRAWHGEGWRVQ